MWSQINIDINQLWNQDSHTGERTGRSKLDNKIILLILSLEISEESESILVFPGLSLLGSGFMGWGPPQAETSMAPIYFHIVNIRKIQPKELPSHSIHCLLTTYTQQLEILGTELSVFVQYFWRWLLLFCPWYYKLLSSEEIKSSLEHSCTVIWLILWSKWVVMIRKLVNFVFPLC